MRDFMLSAIPLTIMSKVKITNWLAFGKTLQDTYYDISMSKEIPVQLEIKLKAFWDLMCFYSRTLIIIINMTMKPDRLVFFTQNCHFMRSCGKA